MLWASHPPGCGLLVRMQGAQGSLPACGAMASNSSKKSTAGAAAAARANTSRTAASLAPMYLFSSSGPLHGSGGTSRVRCGDAQAWQTRCNQSGRQRQHFAVSAPC